MKIGIDARFLTHPQQGGFKTYTENVVRGLAELDRRHEYILYTDGPWDSAFELGPNFRVEPVYGSAIAREQVALPRAMARDRVDVAHYLCNTAPLRQRSRMVLTIHDIIPCMPQRESRTKRGLKFGLLSGYWRTVMPRAARRASHIITISQSSKRDICRAFGIPEDRITVVPTGLHPDFGPVTDQAEIQRVRSKYRLPDRFVLGFVSSDPRKNSARLIEAALEVGARLSDVGLALICSSPEAKEMAVEMAAGRSQSLGRLALIDPMPRRDLVVIYNMAEALAFPSFYEGFGLPVVEAMACGTPVVTSNVSSLPEIAGDAAILVDPADTNAIAAAISVILTDHDLRAEMVSRGATRAAEFGWQRTVTETCAVYERVLGAEAPEGACAGARNQVVGGTAR